MNVTAKRYKVLHYLLLDVFEAFGWLGEGDISMACRNGVTPVHILDLNRWLDASERSRWLCDDLGFESHGHQYDLDHLHFLSLKNDWPKRIALLCKKVKKAAEEYYAIEDSVAVAADLLAIAEALQDNSVDGLAKAAAANKERDRLVAKLPIQHEVDNIMIPHIDNGLSLHKAAVLVGQLQGIAEQVSLLHKAVEPQLHLPGLLQENGKGDLVPNVERPPQHSGGMEKS